MPCRDPHGDVRRQPEVMALKKDFFANGDIIDVVQVERLRLQARDEFDY